MTLATFARHQWTCADYERMVAAGLFEKIELLCGDVVTTGAAVRPYRWTLDDYEQLIALGLLEGKHSVSAAGARRYLLLRLALSGTAATAGE